MPLSPNNLINLAFCPGTAKENNKRKIKHKFDESFEGFHFYEIPFFFENYLSGVKLGLTTYLSITHKSIGKTNDEWEKNKLIFEEKYKNKLPVRLTNNKTFEEKLKFNPNSVGLGMVTYKAEHRIKQSAFTVPKWLKNFVIVNDGTPYNDDVYPCK